VPPCSFARFLVLPPSGYTVGQQRSIGWPMVARHDLDTVGAEGDNGSRMPLLRRGEETPLTRWHRRYPRRDQHLHLDLRSPQGSSMTMIREIHLENLLSFGPDSPVLPLRGLNVLIGPNGSGKSNLIEAISLLQSAPRALASPVRGGGGSRDWLWKGSKKSVASIDVVVDDPDGNQPLRHVLSFTEKGQRFELIDERIENEKPYTGKSEVHFFYRFEKNRPVLNVKGERRSIQREDVDPEQSILSQRKDPDQYPEITYLGIKYD